MTARQCGLCGKDPADGFASVNSVFYCHGDDQTPTCFMQAQWSDIETVKAGALFTPDDPVTCGVCGHQTSVAMFQNHLVTAHNFDADELAEQIANAEIVDLTSVPPDRKGSQ